MDRKRRARLMLEYLDYGASDVMSYWQNRTGVMDAKERAEALTGIIDDLNQIVREEQEKESRWNW